MTRIVHLGLGAFFRAHQAVYTAHAPDAAAWGITAFTGRSPAVAEALAGQGNRYTLRMRGAAGDSYEILRLAAAHAGSDEAAWLDAFRRPELAVVTLTVTEAGYDASGAAVARLVAGLRARRAAGGGGVAIVPCDNLPGNGSLLAAAVREVADPALWAWVEDSVGWVSTAVDRITPRATDADRAAVLAATGFDDVSPVVTEPYSEWVLAGEFPAGRPDWEVAGARFVADVAPYERRKLWLLNGAHSLLAYLGTLRGAATVTEAIGDSVCLAAVEAWWAEAGRHVEAEVSSYTTALLQRFRNPAIEHRLEQIAEDGPRKLAVRVLPVVRLERAAGREPGAAVTVLAAWVAWCRRVGTAADVDPLLARLDRATAAAVLAEAGHPFRQIITSRRDTPGLLGENSRSAGD